MSAHPGYDDQYDDAYGHHGGDAYYQDGYYDHADYPQDGYYEQGYVSSRG